MNAVTRTFGRLPAILILAAAVGATAQENSAENAKPNPKPAVKAEAKAEAKAKPDAKSANAKAEVCEQCEADKPGEKCQTACEDCEMAAGAKKPGGPPMVHRVWMGVATSPVPEPLREHLELAEGFGVQVEHVVGDSPAASAGLRAHDILTKLDDQLLTTPEHLALLVRSKAKGDTVTMTLLRKGAEQTASVTLGETEMPDDARHGFGPGPGPFGLQFQPGPRGGGEWELKGQFPMPNLDGKDFHQAVREYQDRLREWTERGMKGEPPRANRFGHPGGKDGNAPALPEPPKPPLPVPPKPGSVEKTPAEANRPPAVSVRPGFPIEVFSGAGVMRIDNQKGELTIVQKDGKHTITIRNADGETVYDGPYDPAKGTEGLPKEAREQLKEMKLDDLKLLAPSTDPVKADPGEIRDTAKTGGPL